MPTFRYIKTIKIFTRSIAEITHSEPSIFLTWLCFAGYPYWAVREAVGIPSECAELREDATQATLLKISGYTNLFTLLLKLQIHRRLITKPVSAVGFCLKKIIIGYCQHLFKTVKAKIVVQAYAYSNLKLRMYG